MRIQKKQTRSRRMKLTGLLGASLVLSLSLVWWGHTGAKLLTPPSQAAAQNVMQALEADDLKKVMSLNDDPNSQKDTVVYNLLLHQTGKHYKLVKSEQRKLAGKSQASYIFLSSKEEAAKFVRVIVEERESKWVIESLYANAFEPSFFPAQQSAQST